jgi:hypothetical protein
MDFIHRPTSKILKILKKLPFSALNDFPKKDKFKNFFHVVTVSQNLTLFVTEDLAGKMCDAALLIVGSKLGSQNPTKS